MSYFVGYYTGIKVDELPPYINSIFISNLYTRGWVINKGGNYVYFYGLPDDIGTKNTQEEDLIKRLDLIKPLIDIPLTLLTFEVYNDYCKLIGSTIYNDLKLDNDLINKLKVWRQ